MVSETDRYVTVAVAGELSAVTERTIRRWITSGKLPVVSGPRGRLVDLEEVRRLAALSGQGQALDPDHVRTTDGHMDPDRISDRTPDPVVPELVQLLRDRDRILEERDQTIMELSGRLGFVMGQLEEARATIRQLQAPAVSHGLRKPDSLRSGRSTHRILSERVRRPIRRVGSHDGEWSGRAERWAGGL